MKNYILFLLNFSFLMVSCGELSKEKKSQSSIGSQYADCEINSEALTNILEKDISSDILCMESYLYSFMEVVQTDRPGLLSLKHLKTFLQREQFDISPKVIGFLDETFQVKSFLFGESKQYMRRSDIKRMVDLVIDINRFAIESSLKSSFTLHSESLTMDEYRSQKARIAYGVKKIAERILQELGDTTSTLNLMALFTKIRGEFEVDALENFEDLIFLKAVMLGGENEILTQDEFIHLLKHAPMLSKFAWDMRSIETVKWPLEKLLSIVENMQAELRDFSKFFIWEENHNRILIEYSHIQKVFELYFPEQKQYLKYTTPFKKIKYVFLGTETDYFTGADLRKLIDQLLLKTMRKVLFASRVYDENRSLMASSGVEQIRSFFADEEEQSFMNQINYTLHSYHLYRGKREMAYFTFDIKRTKYALIEYLLIQDFIRYFSIVYGHASEDAKGGHYMEMEDFGHLLADLRDFFIGEQIMLPERELSNVQNVTLLTTLFQYHSDGDLWMELDEMTEFMLNFFSSFNIAKHAHEYLINHCKLDEKNRFSPRCFVESFESILGYAGNWALPISEFAPKLNSFYMDAPAHLKREYLEATMGFSRSCTHFDDGAEVPMEKSDLVTFFAGLMTIEQTHLRFDINQDNILNPNEVDRAYPIYEDIIKKLIPVDFLKGKAKEIYLYLIRYRRIPEIRPNTNARDFFHNLGEAGSFVGFLMRVRKHTPASRVTLAAILRTISEESASEATSFDCELLR